MAKCQCDPVPLGWDKARATYTPEIDGVERCRKCQLPIAESDFKPFRLELTCEYPDADEIRSTIAEPTSSEEER